MDSKRNILILVCVVLQCSFAAAASVDNSTKCKFSPNLREPILTLGHSANNEAVVHMSAYLESVGVGDHKYLPLDISDFKFNSLTPSGNYHMLTVEANCAKLFFTLAKDEANWNIKNVHVILNVPVQGVDICHLADVDIVQRPGSHYKCESYIPYICKSKTETGVTNIVRLIMPHFEFEVFGSPERTRDNKFTTDTITSCG